VTAPRRVGARTSPTRSLLLDVTERLMLDEGYAAVSSRSVAALAQVKPSLVHYYFPTLDDLFAEVFDRRTNANFERLAEALTGEAPLHALWLYATDPAGTAFTTEFVALSNHRKAVRSHLLAASERLREMQTSVIATALERVDIDTTLFTPAAVAVLMTAIPRVLVMERAMDFETAHDEVTALVRHFLDMLEPPHDRPTRKRSTKRIAP
jgi:AcrR family transcriptional regulator